MFGGLSNLFGAFASLASFGDPVKYDYYYDEMMSMLNGEPSQGELNIHLWLYIGDNTKFKDVKIIDGEYVSFKSKNRIFELRVSKKRVFTLKYSADTKYEKCENEIVFNNLYELEKYFRKRNYMKK